MVCSETKILCPCGLSHGTDNILAFISIAAIVDVEWRSMKCVSVLGGGMWRCEVELLLC